MTRLIVAALTLGVAVAAPAQTPLIDQSRTAGLVAERYDGFLTAAPQATAALRSQIATVNIRRRAIYSNFASARRVSPQEVGITAGCQLLARVATGEAYILSDGIWRRRGLGQPVPTPAYCG